MKYRVRRVDAGALARQGAGAGALVALAPGAAFGLVGAWVVHALHATLETWKNVRLPIPTNPAVNFVALLHLEPTLDVLRRWDNPAALAFVVILAAFLVAGTISGALVGLTIAAFYNAGAAAGGGLVVELESLSEERPDDRFRRS